MAINFRNIPVLFTGGVDATDEFLVSPRKATTLTDAVFDDAQTIKQRPGQIALNLNPLVSSVPSPYTRTNPAFFGTPYRLAQNQGDLLLEGSAGLFAKGGYNDDGNGSDNATTLQIRADQFPAASPGRPDYARSSVETDFIGVIADQLTNGVNLVAGDQSFDAGRINNYDGFGRACTLWAWAETSDLLGGISRLHVRAFDEGVGNGVPSSRSIVVDLVLNISATAGLQNVRVLASTTDFYVSVFDSDSGSLSFPFRYAPSTGTISYPTYTTAAGGAYDTLIDPTDGRVVIAFSTAANNLRVAKLDAAVAALSTPNNLFVVTGTPGMISLVLTRISGTYRYTALYVCDATQTVLRGVSLTSAGGTTTETTIFTSGIAIGKAVGVDTADNVSSTFALFFDSDRNTVAMMPAGNHFVAQHQVNKTTLADTAWGQLVENCHLYGRPIMHQTNTNAIMVPCAFLWDSSFPSIFIAQASADITSAYYPTWVLNATTNVTAARIHWGASGNIIASWSRAGTLPHSFYVGDSASSITFPVPRWSAQATSMSGNIVASTEIWQARMSTTTQDIGYGEANQDTFLAGSCPQLYDGAFYEEVGFNHRPVISAAAAAGVGSLSAGTYTIYATYVHKDQRGNICESAPSAPFTFTALAGQTYTATVLPPGATAKRSVSTRIYRTVANGSIAYLDSAFKVSDTVLSGNTRIPTDGGILPNQPMPACRVVTEHQNRLWCAGGEAGDTIYFSQPISQGVLPEWNRLLYRRVPKSAGRVVNLVSIDDKLVVFCEQRIGFIYGEGPTRTGAQDGYSEFVETVSGYDIPWAEPHSIIRCTEGVWFRCGFGFRLLGRNMAIAQDSEGADLASEIDSLIGPTQAGLPGPTVVRAVTATTGQQVRFYMSDGTAYVFDLIFKQWSIFTNQAAVDTTAIGNNFYRITSTPAMFAETTTAVDDNGTKISSTVETSWLAVAGLMGYKRVNRIQVLGQSPFSSGTTSDWDITVSAQYDYIDPNGTSTQLYSGIFLKSGAGTAPARQIEMQPVYQKCEALRLKITFTPHSSGFNSGKFRLTGINMLVGLKKGRYKIATANKV